VGISTGRSSARPGSAAVPSSAPAPIPDAARRSAVELPQFRPPLIEKGSNRLGSFAFRNRGIIASMALSRDGKFLGMVSTQILTFFIPSFVLPISRPILEMSPRSP